jgi:DNA-binding transcriptional MerR regulator|tara:strand:+ start:1233 stop:1661 length:429 start_codon:yes stop_codon:yes gene_type:complete
MRIGEVAAAAGVDPQTIRFYERRGLLPPPQRDPNGYRAYEDPILPRLQFIRSGQGAGLTLVEIATILDMRGDGVMPCLHVRDLLSTKLRDVRARRAELAALEAELEALINRSDGLNPVDCTDTDVCHIISQTPVTKAPNPSD